MNSVVSSTRGGFTLIEVLIAISIGIAVMVGGFWGINKAFDALNRYRTSSRLSKISFAIGQYRLAVQKLPTRLDDMVKGPKEEKERKRWVQAGGAQLSEDDLIDGWDSKFVYKLNPAGSGKKAYELYSYGPQGPGSPAIEHISADAE